MFGVGAQEIVIIVVVLLIVFGPAKLGHMAKEVGRFAYKARASMEEFKEEFSVAQGPDRGPEESGRSHSEHRPPSTRSTFTSEDRPNSARSRRGQNTDGSLLLRPPAKDTVVAESPQRGPLRIKG
jgi:Sec-independent protein translocase protein TatA